MPTNIEDVSTKDLIEGLLPTSSLTFTSEQIGAELKLRIYPDDYEVEECRGGVRPTHPPHV